MMHVVTFDNERVRYDHTKTMLLVYYEKLGLELLLLVLVLVFASLTTINKLVHTCVHCTCGNYTTT